MTKRIIWKNGDYISIQLDEKLFTIAQMRARPVMKFFNITSDSNDWNTIEWAQIKPLFQVFVGSIVQNELSTGKIKTANPRPLELPHYWIKPYSSMDSHHYYGTNKDFMFFGGKLIDLGPNNDRDVTTAPVIKHDLTTPRDSGIIEKYELTNMWGSRDLKDRLLRFFRTGIDRDDLKFEIFPDLWSDREKLSPLTCRLPIQLR